MEIGAYEYFENEIKRELKQEYTGLPFKRRIEDLCKPKKRSEEMAKQRNYKEIAKKIINHPGELKMEVIFDLCAVEESKRDHTNLNNLKNFLNRELKEHGVQIVKGQGVGIYKLNELKNEVIKEKVANNALVYPDKPIELLEVLISNPEKIKRINELFDAEGFGLEYVITGIELRKKG